MESVKKSVSDAQKRAFKKYQDTHKSEHTERQRNYYYRMKELDPDALRLKRNEQQRKYYAKKRAEREAKQV
jgi:hypothetical protein